MDGWMHAWMDALSHGWMDAFSKKNDKQNHGFLNFMAVYFDLLHVFFQKIRFEGMKTKFGWHHYLWILFLWCPTYLANCFTVFSQIKRPDYSPWWWASVGHSLDSCASISHRLKKALIALRSISWSERRWQTVVCVGGSAGLGHPKKWMVKYMSIIISTYDVIDTSFFVYTQGSGTLKVWVGTLKVWVDSQGKNALKVRWDSQGKGTLMVHTPVSQSLSPNPFSFQDFFFHASHCFFANHCNLRRKAELPRL